MATPLHHAEWVILRHSIFRICVVISCCSILANFLPNERVFEGKPARQAMYEMLIFFVAAFSFNWRADLPGLDGEWMGFRAKCRGSEPISRLGRRFRERRNRRHNRRGGSC